MRGTWEILATDIGRFALDTAERATYSGRTIASVTERQLAAHFAPAGNAYQVRPRIRKMVNFVQMNLSNPVYVGRMDPDFLYERADLFLRRAQA